MLWSHLPEKGTKFTYFWLLWYLWLLVSSSRGYMGQWLFADYLLSLFLFTKLDLILYVLPFQSQRLFTKICKAFEGYEFFAGGFGFQHPQWGGNIGFLLFSSDALVIMFYVYMRRSYCNIFLCFSFYVI